MFLGGKIFLHVSLANSMGRRGNLKKALLQGMAKASGQMDRRNVLSTCDEK